MLTHAQESSTGNLYKKVALLAQAFLRQILMQVHAISCTNFRGRELLLFGARNVYRK